MILIAINIIGLLLILGIVKWFWLTKPTLSTHASETITIVVKDGIYQPAVIKIKAGQVITLNFLRQDPTPCSEMVIFPELNISMTLPLSSKKSLTIEPKNPGRYPFTCQMGMYKGTLIVE
jgi:plastocyanin domain-containing protein